MSDVITVRRFRVHAREEARDQARVVVERSFEAAAVAWVEGAHLTDRPDVSVIVRDVESGHEHCFRIDTRTGEAAGCDAGERIGE